MAREKVRADERKKAHFLSDLRRVCRRHKMMIALAVDASDGSEGYAVFDVSQAPERLDSMIQDILIHDVVHTQG